MNAVKVIFIIKADKKIFLTGIKDDANIRNIAGLTL